MIDHNHSNSSKVVHVTQ